MVLSIDIQRSLMLLMINQPLQFQVVLDLESIMISKWRIRKMDLYLLLELP